MGGEDEQMVFQATLKISQDDSNPSLNQVSLHTEARHSSILLVDFVQIEQIAIDYILNIDMGIKSFEFSSDHEDIVKSIEEAF